MSISVWRRWTLGAALSLGALALTPALAQAQEFLSIRGKAVNVREQPAPKANVAWELVNGYPVQVVQRKGQWLKVKDFESTLGWVQKTQTAKVPHLLVKVRVANLRSQPSPQGKVVGKLEKYDIVKTLEKKKGWAKVRTSAGREGWLREDMGWGW